METMTDGIPFALDRHNAIMPALVIPAKAGMTSPSTGRVR